jgi:hypothetical protein
MRKLDCCNYYAYLVFTKEDKVAIICNKINNPRGRPWKRCIPYPPK